MVFADNLIREGGPNSDGRIPMVMLRIPIVNFWATKMKIKNRTKFLSLRIFRILETESGHFSPKIGSAVAGPCLGRNSQRSVSQ